MGTITAIETQQRSRNRVSVFVDDVFAIGLDARTAVDAGLRVGDELSGTDLHRLENQEAMVSATDRVYRLLSHRPRSVQEVRQRLRQAETEPEIAEAVIEDLTERGYLNDEEFARYWVANRQANRPRGAMLLRSELRQKGVDNETIECALTDTDIDELDLALEFAQSRLHSLRGLDAVTFRRRLGGQLSRKGYPYPVVRTVIEELLADAEASNDMDRDRRPGKFS